MPFRRKELCYAEDVCVPYLTQWPKCVDKSEFVGRQCTLGGRAASMSVLIHVSVLAL